jgi:signal transduction histidine kinase/DNA-binding response OmpR family regulator/HPt (histidine-containing phosphotransfer) domain-containing protein
LAGLRLRLFAAFAAIATLAAAIAAFALAGLQQVESGMGAFALTTMPTLVTARSTADTAGELAVPINSLLHAGGKADQTRWLQLLDARMADLEVHRATLVGQLSKDSTSRAQVELLGTAIHALTTVEHRFRQAVTQRIQAADEVSGRIAQAGAVHAAFVENAKVVERQTRSLATLALATRLSEARGKRDLDSKLDGFIEREMSWVATAQELRSNGSELLALITSVTGADGEAQLLAMRRQALIASVRMALIDRLPDSQPVHQLHETAATLTAVVDGGDNIFDLRRRELAAKQDLALVHAEMEGAAATVRNAAQQLVAVLSARAEASVAETRSDIINTRLLLAVLSVAAVVAAVLIAWLYVGRNVAARILELGHCMLEAARDINRIVPSAIGDRALAIARGSDDEIAAMARALKVFADALSTREAALHKAMSEAEAHASAKADFLATMSHEIRTPMNAVLGLAHLLERMDLDSRQRDFVNKIQTAGQTLLGLLNDVLDFSKIEAGRLELDPVEFSLDELLADLGIIAAVNVRNKDVEVLFGMAPEVPRRLLGDPLRLQQVLLNLVGNAIKFTDAGTVCLRATQVKRAGGRTLLRFEIQDTGIGITAEQKANLFQAFSQADSSTSRRFGGTGLGLAISSRLVALMGGHIDVDSVPGQGSLFHFTACFGVAETGTAPAIAPGEPAMTVLVADDNAAMRDIMADMITALGWRAVLAASGEEALAALERQPVDAALIDWAMPGLGGLETCRRIKAGDTPPPVIMMVTAAERERQAGHPHPHEVDAILAKPFSLNQMAETVRTSIAGPAAGPETPQDSPPSANLHGLRLLLVEDNAINQLVAKELLQGAGAEIITADDGRMALEVLVREDMAIDAVLMDIQMPHMDGYDATRAIRALPRFASLPIIAMTANAFPEDRERCMAAGMNDHLSKPLDVGRLYAKLAQWLGCGAEPELPPATPAHPLGDADAVIDWGTARQVLGPDLMAATFGHFRQCYGDAAGRLSALAQAGDLEVLSEEAHALKGASGYIAANRLRDAACRLEQLAKDGDRAGVHAAALHTETELTSVLSYLRDSATASA